VALYAEDRLKNVSLEGDNQFLRPNAAQYLGLALHELTTNAIKYGALSVANGEVWVRFERSAGDPGVHRFTWNERKGPPVHRPKGGRSFGLMMISQVVPAAVGGAAHVDFEEAGLSYELDIPKAQLVT
jgi:two-component sensor histidine kinase